MNILFVCTGNSCRSVMAEGLFRRAAGERAEEFTVSSAGVSAIDGFAPTQETVRAMRAEGVDVSEHLSRRVTQDMVEKADRIFVMEKMHQWAMTNRWPEAAPKIALLSDYSAACREKGMTDIPDPIRMTDDYYKNVLGMIREAVQNILKTV